MTRIALDELDERIIERLFDRMQARLDRADVVLSAFPARLQAQSERQRDRLGNVTRRGDGAIAILLARHRQTLVAQDRILQSLSYKNVLGRGYAVIRGEGDRVLSSAAMVAAGDRLSIEFHDGAVEAVAGSGGAPSGPSPAKKRPSPKPASGPSGQGSLF